MKNRVHVFITCRLLDGDAFYFTKPIADINIVEKVSVFRDVKGADYQKVRYILPFFKNLKGLGFFLRNFQMIFAKVKNLKLIVGIYEIPHGIIAMIVGKILRKPVVVCIIGNPAYTPIRSGFRKKFTYFILRNVNFISTTGSKSKEFLISEGFASDKVVILPNSIDVEYFKPMQNFPKKYDIITLGRLSPEKQLNVLIDIISVLKKDIHDIKVGIGGKGPDAELLKNKIEQMGLQNNIDLLGFIPDDVLVAFLNSGKIFVSCSETEGFPRTVIQSVSSGTPCISSNVGDMEDLIINDFTGYLIDNSTDTESYAIKILDLLKNEKKYKEFKENGLILVKEKFSHKAASEMWIDVLNRIEK